MPTQQHEYLIELVRNRPSLVTTLLAGAGITSPSFDEASLANCDFPEVTPTEYRADSVVVLHQEKRPVRAVVLKVQRQYDHGKRWSWPVYLSNLRARVKCPVILIVFCENPADARKCAEAIDMGHPGWVLIPIVIGHDKIPVITDALAGAANAELMALSTIVHGNLDTPIGRDVLRTFVMAQNQRPETDESYNRLVFSLLPNFDQTKFEEIILMSGTDDIELHPFLRKWIEVGETKGKAKGKAQGNVEGKAASVMIILNERRIPIPAEVQERIRECTDQELLDTWIKRAMAVHNAEDLFDTP